MKPTTVLATTLSILFLAAGTSSVAAQETLVVNSWGGPYEKLHKQIILKRV